MDIKDIKGPLNFGFDWVTAGIIILLLILAAAVIWFLKVRNKSISSEGKPAEQLPPYEAARRALDSLRGRGFGPIGRAGDYYSELSSIVRYYLEGRFALCAVEMTTEEFLAAARESKALLPAHRELLRDFLNHCDMVKFARYQPQAEQMAESFALADRFVEETKPAEVDHAAA